MSEEIKNPASQEKDDNWNYSFHVVAFLDILGQRDAFKGIVGVPRTPAEEARLIEALKQTVAFVPKFREGFRGIFKTYSESSGREFELPEEFRQEFLQMRRSSIKLHGLSDAVVAWTSLMEDDQCGALNGLYGILMASAGMFALSLACKHAIRGGIELEGAIPLQPDSLEIYGPALAKAYELESRKADYPRILVGEGVMKYLAEMRELVPNDRVSTHNKRMAEQCLGLIARDRDGKFIVDYLGNHVLRVASDAMDKDKVLIPARRFVAEAFSHQRKSGDAHLAQRYEKVLAYFDERLPELRDKQKDAPVPASVSNTERIVPYVTVRVDGAPPWKQTPADDKERDRMAERKELLQAQARAVHQNALLEGPLGLTIRYTRKFGKSDSANIVGGVADALQGILYENDRQLTQIDYAEHSGDRELYEVGVAPAGFQIPTSLEQRGDIGILRGDPAVLFPDDEASRWMLGLLAASHDIGLALKLIAPFLAVPRSEIEPQFQYRVSHMLYFFRLWMGHIHEGWVAFNKQVVGEIVDGVRLAETVKEALTKISDLRGRRIGETSVGELMEQCRHSAFHYSERVGDKWKEQLGLLAKPFSLCVTHGAYLNVDSRWLIADEYLLSRLNRLDFGNRELHPLMRDMALETMNLIQLAQVEYFKRRDSDWDIDVPRNIG